MGDRTTKNHPSDKDGLAKNLDKLGGEFGKVKDAVRNAGDSHDPLTNAAVEATRASPYLMGHVMLIGGAILVAVIIALVAFG